MKAIRTKVGKQTRKSQSAKRKKEKSPEESLQVLNTRSQREVERLEALTPRHETTLKERAVLIEIIRCQQLARSGQAPPKKIIESADVYSFMAHASQLYERLQRRLHIPLRYEWFCQWLCTKYDIRRQRGGGAQSVLSPYTVLSYFKRERAGG